MEFTKLSSCLSVSSFSLLYRLTLLELQRSCVFEGRPERLFLTYDLTALDDRMYYEAGVLIGWSLAHGGPGPSCLHPALYQVGIIQTETIHKIQCIMDIQFKLLWK